MEELLVGDPAFSPTEAPTKGRSEVPCTLYRAERGKRRNHGEKDEVGSNANAGSVSRSRYLAQGRSGDECSSGEDRRRPSEAGLVAARGLATYSTSATT